MLEDLSALEPTDEATLSERISDATKEVARLALEATIGRMARYEPSELPRGADGVERTQSRTRARSLVSIFGEVHLERRGAAAPGVESLFVADAWLNLGHGQLARYSLALRHRVAHCVAEGSFRNAEATLERFGCPSIGRRQLEQIAVAAACDFSAFYERGAHITGEMRETVGPRDLLVLSFDAKGVPMILSGLRDGTYERAISAPKRDRGDPVAPGHKPDRKRMAQVATLYFVSPNPRQPSDILRGGYERPKPSEKRIFGSVEEDPIVTMRRVFTEAERRDPDHEREWVVLIDGCPHQLRRVEALLAEFEVEAAIILDLVHVQEKLWAAARALFGDNATAKKKWVSQRLERLLCGKSPRGVARGMRQSATKRRLSKSRRKPVDECARYLCNAAPYLDYATALSNGWPIATGVIEGTCRHLVGERLVIGGAKWSLPGAEAILRLRALTRNDDFERYWAFHERREWERNHASRYADGHVPGPRPELSGGSGHLRLVK